MNNKSSSVTSVSFVEITSNQVGQRIDNFLLKTLKNLPKSRLYRIIRKGEVRVNKKRIKPEYKLNAGDVVRIPPIRLDTDNEQEIRIPAKLLVKLEASILFENKDIIVLNKPQGLAVHSGSGLRYGVIDAMRILRADTDIELVHRLDRDTSGCLLLAKNRASLLAMQKLLQSNAMQKNYIALVKGHWNPSIHEVTSPLLRQTMPNGERKVFVDDRGQPAQTQIEKVQHFSRQDIPFSLLHIRLLTGRTHQIRVHCQSLGHEIAGDAKYGDRDFNRRAKTLGIKNLCLHAVALEIPQNAHTSVLKIVAPIPSEIRDLTSE